MFFHGPRDPGVYLVLLISILLVQLLVWGIARHSVYLDWWRSASLAIVAGVVTLLGMTIGGGFLPGFVFGVMAVYLFAGLVYEFELWQRIVVTVSVPILSFLSFIGGFALKDWIYENLLT